MGSGRSRYSNERLLRSYEAAKSRVNPMAASAARPKSSARVEFRVRLNQLSLNEGGYRFVAGSWAATASL
jgi:hypothetical protein